MLLTAKSVAKSPYMIDKPLHSLLSLEYGTQAVCFFNLGICDPHIALL
jgi:hypothetical protein